MANVLSVVFPVPLTVPEPSDAVAVTTYFLSEYAYEGIAERLLFRARSYGLLIVPVIVTVLLPSPAGDVVSLVGV